MAKNSYLPFHGLRGKPLSEREITVMRLYSREDTVAQIASRLCIAESTVRSDIRNCINKMGTTNITCAIKKAEKLGLL